MLVCNDPAAGVGANAAALAREIVEYSESTGREARPGAIRLFARWHLTVCS